MEYLSCEVTLCGIYCRQSQEQQISKATLKLDIMAIVASVEEIKNRETWSHTKLNESCWRERVSRQSSKNDVSLGKNISFSKACQHNSCQHRGQTNSMYISEKTIQCRLYSDLQCRSRIFSVLLSKHQQWHNNNVDCTELFRVYTVIILILVKLS